MGPRVQDLPALLALQTVGVPVVAQRLPPLSKVDRSAALLTRPHTGQVGSPYRVSGHHIGGSGHLYTDRSPGHLECEGWLSQIYCREMRQITYQTFHWQDRRDSECGDEVGEELVPQLGLKYRDVRT